MIHKKIIDLLLINEAEHFTVYGLITVSSHQNWSVF